MVTRLRLEIPGVTSLKEKRHILKSLLTKMRNEFNVSIAEVGLNDILRQAEIAAAVVANDTAFAHEVMDKLVRRVEGRSDVLLAQIITESY